MGNFKNLQVWQKSVDLAASVYKLTKETPLSKDYGLIDQLRRSAVSIASNIAEGDELKSDAQATRHFFYSKASTAELMTQIIIAEKVGYLDKAPSDEIIFKCEEISKMLNALIRHRS